ncbi:MAG: ABC transporter ATP-binding protein [Nitrospinota bacterium]
MIEVEGLHLSYRSRQGVVEALGGVGLRIEENEFVTVVGPSGCGKSTLLKVVSGILAPTRGRIRLSGQDLGEVDLEGRFGFIFQRPLLLPWRTALENVMLPGEIVAKQVGRGERQKKALDLLNLTGLRGFEDRYPHELSGGMAQRVSLSRALSFEPSILLMDEPFGALDEITREAMQGELLRIWGQIRSTILFVTHSIGEAVLLSDRVLVMSSRPGTMLENIDIPFSRPRSESLRGEPEFVRIVEHTRGLLRESSQASSLV